ncbi:MAG: aspartate aminotransferase family protein [Bacteroidales bacterium]|jgi:acetylornithine/succinyldiaminopimelate/putrescine aminotransferase|nr:aspartate aminotransferase family protein [Bacteroidales bacterium]
MNLKELFFRHVAQTSDEPLAIEIEKAENIYLYTPDGKRFIDLISGVSVSNIGHSHPSVVKAIQQQAEKYLHLMVYGEIVQSPQVLLAQKLASLLPQSLDSVYFVNSGSEAIEGAVKLARRYSGKTEIISCHNAYHGCTCGSMSLMGDAEFVRSFRPLLPDCKKIVHGQLSDIEQITTKTAAVVIEVVQGEAGVRYVGKNYWQQLRQRCTETQTLLILDEIQTGFGRTGTWFAFEQMGITPDILVLAKALGGGLPLGAFIAPSHIMQTLTYAPVLGHITTFGGHPLCCAAALATIGVLERENLIAQVESKALLFKQLLSNIPKIKEFRQQGFMMALDFGDKDFNFNIIKKYIANGLLTDWFLFCDTALRLAPPLIITEQQIEESCQIITQTIN